MKLPTSLFALSCFLVGAVAADFGPVIWPAAPQFLLELKFTPSSHDDFVCSKTASQLTSLDLSSYDSSVAKQTNCVLLVRGHPNSDGSFEVNVPVSSHLVALYRGRVNVTIDQKWIKGVRPF
jgi:hypothetical protein